MRKLVVRQRLDAHRLDHHGYAIWLDVAPCQIPRHMPAQDCSSRHDAAPLDVILQFPDITGPVMAFQSRHHLFRDRGDHLALLFSELLNKVCAGGGISSPRSRSGSLECLPVPQGPRVRVPSLPPTSS
jgi:hypothetical protein